MEQIKCGGVPQEYDKGTSQSYPIPNHRVNINILKAAVLLGAPEARASKEMGEVVEFIEKLFNLTINFCSEPLTKGNQSKVLTRMKQMLNSPDVSEPSHSVSHLQTLYPEVNNSSTFPVLFFALDIFLLTLL